MRQGGDIREGVAAVSKEMLAAMEIGRIPMRQNFWAATEGCVAKDRAREGKKVQRLGGRAQGGRKYCTLRK